MIMVTIGPLTFDAGPTAGGSQWICQNLEGWFSAPPMRGSTSDYPVADGAFGSVKNYRSARSLTFNGMLIGKSQSDAQQTLMDAFAALQPDGVPFTLSVATDLGVRSVKVTLDGVPTVEPMQGLTAATVMANLIAYDPVKYGPTSIQTVGTPTAGGGLEYALGDVGGSVGSASGALFYGALGNLGRLSLTNNGTAAVYPVFNIAGGLPGGFYIQCLETGAVVQYSSVVPAGTTITLDMGAETVAINGIQGGDNFLTQLNWFSVPPKSTITVQINPLGGGRRLTDLAGIRGGRFLVTRFIIGDLLTGRRINNLNVLSGSWSQVLDDSGDLSCTVSLRDPATRRLGLSSAASTGKAFLAAVQDNNILQAGPVWVHDYDRDAQTLTLTASGMWSYFDHRVLIPLLAGRLPTDTTTDTNFASSSLHDIAAFLVLQAQTWTNGNVPVTLPAGIAGTAIRNYKGSDLGMVGSRLRELTQVLGGPDILFQPAFTSDMLGVTWSMQIGTPAQPLLFAPQDVYFNPTASKRGSISGLKVHSDGTGMASQTFATGGATSDAALMTISTDPTLTAAGYALLEATDTTHTDATELPTVQGYSDELVLLGKSPLQAWSFTHDTTISAPLIGSFRQGDFAQIRMHGDPYIPDGTTRHRITAISGDEIGRKVDIVTQPQVM